MMERVRLVYSLAARPYRAARRVGRFVLPIRYRPIIHRRDDRTWPCGPFLRWAGSGRIRHNVPELGPVHAAAAALQSGLRSEVRETGFRHELRTMNAGEVCDVVSSPPVARAILYRLVVLHRPRHVLDVGSAFGLASMAMAVAVRDVHGDPAAGHDPGGWDDSPVWFDGVEYEGWRAEIADANVKSVLGPRGVVHAGRAEDVAPAVVERRCPVAFCFVDVMHTYDAHL
jgi:hypothetical protein